MVLWSRPANHHEPSNTPVGNSALAIEIWSKEDIEKTTVNYRWQKCHKSKKYNPAMSH